MKSRILHPLARLAALSLSLLIASPVAVQAQAALSPLKVVTAIPSAKMARADTMEQRALELTLHTSAWRDAAKLYRTAAELRAGDPSAPASYRMAAWLYSASGSHGQARKLLAKAAEQSASTGDPALAAHTWIDAALAAAADNRGDLVPDLLDKARVLAASIAVTAEQRVDIERRLPADPVVASTR